jgi:hypothetical protein
MGAQERQKCGLVAKRRHACRRGVLRCEERTSHKSQVVSRRSIRFWSRSDGMLKPGVVRCEERTSHEPQVISKNKPSGERSARHWGPFAETESRPAGANGRMASDTRFDLDHARTNGSSLARPIRCSPHRPGVALATRGTRSGAHPRLITCRRYAAVYCLITGHPEGAVATEGTAKRSGQPGTWFRR